MKLFSALRGIREFERLHLPLLKSMLDFDLVIEIGYAEEQAQPLTLKQLLLLNLSSRTTVRRKLEGLIERGIVRRRKSARDQRSSILGISSSGYKSLAKYSAGLKKLCAEVED